MGKRQSTTTSTSSAAIISAKETKNLSFLPQPLIPLGRPFLPPLPVGSVSPHNRSVACVFGISDSGEPQRTRVVRARGAVLLLSLSFVSSPTPPHRRSHLHFLFYFLFICFQGCNLFPSHDDGRERECVCVCLSTRGQADSILAFYPGTTHADADAASQRLPHPPSPPLSPPFRPPLFSARWLSLAGM